MAGATAIGYLDRQLLPIAKRSISLELGWGEVDYATVIAAGQAGVAVGLLLGGMLVDRIPLKWGAPLIIGASSLAALCTGFASTLEQHIAARVMLGAALALGVPTFLKVISAILPSPRLAMGIAAGTVASAVGAIAAPLLVPQLTAGLGWRAAFHIVGSVGLAWALMWFLVVRPAEQRGLIDAGSEPPGATLRLLRLPRLWALAGAKTLSDATWWLLLFWLPDLFTRSFGLVEVEFAAPLALIYAFSAAGSLVAGMASVRLFRLGLPLHRVRYSAMFLSALCTAILPVALLATQPMVAALLIGLAVAGHQGFSVNLFALITEVAPKHMVGRYTALCVFCGNLGGMAVTIVAGLMLSARWSYAPMLIAAPFCYLLALALLARFVPRVGKRPENGDVGPPALA